MNKVMMKTITIIFGLVLIGGLVQGCKQEAVAEAEPTKAANASPESAKPEPVVEVDTSTVEGRIIQKLSAARKDLKYSDFKPSPIKGIYQGLINNGEGVIYVTEDAEYFFPGDMIQVTQDGFVNITENQKNGLRKTLLADVSRDDMIIFSPKGEVKASIAVFTDVDCGYCQKLHQEVPKLNELGVEVKYLAYPRAGIGSASYKKVVSAWCADDRQEALTKLKRREFIPEKLCDTNPIAKQFSLARKVGVTGTPALVLEDGTLIPGYMKADQLANRLGI